MPAIQAGGSTPACSAMVSAMAASRLSRTGTPLGEGGSAMAATASAGWGARWSVKARSLLKSGNSPPGVRFHASARAQSVTPLQTLAFPMAPNVSARP